MASPLVLVRDHGAIRELRMNRAEVHNALNEELIELLTEAFEEITRTVEAAEHEGESFWIPTNGGKDTTTAYDTPGVPRGVLLTGEGPSFCAGADIEYMERLAKKTPEENLADARRVSRLFQAIRSCPVYTIARVQGAALGGGAGLVAACDFAIAADNCRFGFTEVQLGILPAVISPFVLDRIGAANGRAWFPTGERFDADQALRMGLVNRVVPVDALADSVQSTIKLLLAAAPSASRAAKKLVEMVSVSLPLQIELERNLGEGHDCDDPEHDHTEEEHEEEASIFEETAQWIAALRAAPEGREGLSAFMEKRKPGWVIPPIDEA